MIPKTIHYCWFGNNELPPIVKKCIASWQKLCPEYEIKRWDESNYYVNRVPYVKEAYDAKKYAFVSDYARLDIVYNHGGVYLDTDMELIKNIDDLLDCKGFIANDGTGINTGIGVGAEKGHPAIKAIMDMYANRHFKTASGFDLTVCTYFNSEPFTNAGYDIRSEKIETFLGMNILPPSYFSPIRSKNGIIDLYIEDSTHGIHWNNRSWETGWTKIKSKIRLFIGFKNVTRIRSLIRKIKKAL